MYYIRQTQGIQTPKRRHLNDSSTYFIRETCDELCDRPAPIAGRFLTDQFDVQEWALTWAVELPRRHAADDSWAYICNDVLKGNSTLDTAINAINLGAMKSTLQSMDRRNLEIISYCEKGQGHCLVSIASQCPKISTAKYNIFQP